MRIGLIAMSGVRVRNAELARLGVTLPQFVSRGKVIASLPSLGLLTVAALTPADCEVMYREIAELTRRRRSSRSISSASRRSPRRSTRPTRWPIATAPRACRSSSAASTCR